MLKDPFVFVPHSRQRDTWRWHWLRLIFGFLLCSLYNEWKSIRQGQLPECTFGPVALGLVMTASRAEKSYPPAATRVRNQLGTLDKQGLVVLFVFDWVLLASHSFKHYRFRIACTHIRLDLLVYWIALCYIQDESLHVPAAEHMKPFSGAEQRYPNIVRTL